MIEQNYIEPCCCARQLPEVFNKAVPFFQTNGDVTLDKILSSVAYLAGVHPVLVFTAQDIELDFIKLLKHYFDRGWIDGAILVSSSQMAEQLRTEAMLKEYLGDYIHQVQFATDPLIYECQLAVIGTSAVIIRGYMSMDVTFGLTMYSGLKLSKDYSEVVDAALSPIVAKAKLKPIIDNKENGAINRILSRKYFYE